jgi:hypothetical protein
MTLERILEETQVNSQITVTTMEKVEYGQVPGIHPILRTIVSGVEGLDSSTPHRQYVNQIAAKIGHDMVVTDTRRMVFEQRLMADGIVPVLVCGAL